MSESYAVTAQFYDAVADEAHAIIDAQIRDALGGLDTRPGPVLDIGAGTGLTTRVIAAALPDAEIFAIEPDAGMRSALMTRVWSDDDLRRRVTILPMGILESPLPDVISGAVLSASLVHFAPDTRARLWKTLASRLAPGGRVVVEVQCPISCDMVDTRMSTASVGRMMYEGWASARRIDSDRQRWMMTYRTLMNGIEVRRDQAEYLCWAVSSEAVIAEATEMGFKTTGIESLIVLEPSSWLSPSCPP